MSTKPKTTKDAAKAANLSHPTLSRWIKAGKIAAPKLTIRNGRTVRLWDSAAISLLIATKSKIFHRGIRAGKSKAG